MIARVRSLWGSRLRPCSHSRVTGSRRWKLAVGQRARALGTLEAWGEVAVVPPWSIHTAHGVVCRASLGSARLWPQAKGPSWRLPGNSSPPRALMSQVFGAWKRFPLKAGYMWELGSWDRPHHGPTAEVIEGLGPKIKEPTGAEEEGEGGSSHSLPCTGQGVDQAACGSSSSFFFCASPPGSAPLPRQASQKKPHPRMFHCLPQAQSRDFVA